MSSKTMYSTTALPAEMQSVTVHPTQPLIKTTISTIALPNSLAPNEVLIKVYAAASNQKDWLHVVARGVSLNSGDDLAGTVAGLGSDVAKFQTGDKVAVFHPMGQPYGAYAEYAVAPAHTVFRIPKAMSFEEASTIPLVSLTAGITLFRRQGFAAPWDPETMGKNGQQPLLVYGATTALGTYAIKLAKLAGVGPIIAIGGGSSEYLRTLLTEDDVFLDYRTGMVQIRNDIGRIAKERNLKLLNAIDAFSASGSWVEVSQMLDGGRLSVFSGANEYDEARIPTRVRIVYTYVGTGHEGAYKPGMPKQPAAEDAQGDVKFAEEFFIWMADMLEQGRYTGHPYEVVPGGLSGVAKGLNRLQYGQAGGKKLVYIVWEGL
ncbi:hypothetical protein LTR06_002443 [Exophiala xenobiotica]|nr:hypothetical protein LTR06_002443 [Exophiala xenobiotica]